MELTVTVPTLLRCQQSAYFSSVDQHIARFHSPPCNEHNYAVHMRYLQGNMHTLADPVTHMCNAAHPFPPPTVPDLSLKISPSGKGVRQTPYRHVSSIRRKFSALPPTNREKN